MRMAALALASAVVLGLLLLAHRQVEARNVLSEHGVFLGAGKAGSGHSDTSSVSTSNAVSMAAETASHRGVSVPDGGGSSTNNALDVVPGGESSSSSWDIDLIGSPTKGPELQRAAAGAHNPTGGAAGSSSGSSHEEGAAEEGAGVAGGGGGGRRSRTGMEFTRQDGGDGDDSDGHGTVSGKHTGSSTGSKRSSSHSISSHTGVTSSSKPHSSTSSSGARHSSASSSGARHSSASKGGSGLFGPVRKPGPSPSSPSPPPLDPSFVDDWDPLDMDSPRTNLTLLPRTCTVMRRICAYQETLVTHDWRYSYANPRREPLPDMPWVENWNFPAAVGANSDALRGRGQRYRLHLRPASGFEPLPSLRHPVFSNRTLPVLVVADFPFNMGEFFAKVLTAVDQMELDDRVTLVLQTPMGLGLAAFHSLFMLPYSRYPVITAADLGSISCEDKWVGSPAAAAAASTSSGSGWVRSGGSPPICPVAWSPEPSRPRCFQRMILCKWDLANGGGSPLARVARRVVAAVVGRGLLPASPVRWGQAGGAGGGGGGSKGLSTTLRVLIESRQGPVRNIKNLEELLTACKELDRSGFSAGPFRRLACASTSFAGPDGAVDRKRFLENLAAVRSAHVLVVLHGAGATNSWFMRQNASALVELRPCGFGTHFGSWPDKYMPKQHEKNDDVVRFFALNVEDPEQCMQGDIETGLRNRTTRKDNVGWDASYFARDQHLRLKPGPFLEFLHHVGALMTDVGKYQAARDGGKLHAYVVPEGLMYGKLGIEKLKEYRAAKDPPVIPF